MLMGYHELLKIEGYNNAIIALLKETLIRQFNGVLLKLNVLGIRAAIALLQCTFHHVLRDGNDLEDGLASEGASF